MGNEPVSVGAGQNTPPLSASEQMVLQQQQLLRLMLEREARQAKKEEDDERARQVRDVQRQKNAQSHSLQDIVRQARCTHLKGGKGRLKSQNKDYAVYHFTFTNARQVIRCQICRMEWRAQDTKEFLFRKGKKIANHTQRGWNEAQEMLASSSNTAGSAEIPLQAAPVPLLSGNDD
jgi:hypothetical protein